MVRDFFLLIVKGHSGPKSNVQLPGITSTAEPTQFQSQAFASPFTSFGMTHCNFLIKKLILGVKCQKMKKKSLVLQRLRFFFF